MPEPIVTLNEESLRTDLRELVRGTVEDTLNACSRRRPATSSARSATSAPQTARLTARGTTSGSSRRPPAR